jgi:hypothetical protein
MAYSLRYAITQFDCESSIEDRALQLCIGRNVLLPEDTLS